MRLQGRSLRAGMAGEDVAALHSDLDRLGYPIPRGERDDKILGVGTAGAIAHFQRAHGLWDTAVVDPNTARMLDRAIEEASLPTVAVPVPDGAAAREPPRLVPDGEPIQLARLDVPRGEEPTFVPRRSAPEPAPVEEPVEEPTLVPRTAPAPVAVPPIQVAVCGPGDCTEQERQQAYQVGRLLARDGAVVICGGGAGVMAGVAAGARAGGGLVLGILPGGGRGSGSPHLSAVVATNLGEARNAVIVESADAVITIGGSWGTLSELALAKRRGRIPVVALGGWRVVDGNGVAVPGVEYVDTPDAAVTRALGSRGQPHHAGRPGPGSSST